MKIDWRDKRVRWCAYGIAFAIAIAVAHVRARLDPSFLEPQGAPSRSVKSVRSSESYRTKQGFFGCTTRTALDRAIDFEVAKDYTALDKLITTGLCNYLKPARPAVIEDVAEWEGVVKIRLKGEIASIWTAIEAIEPVGNPFNVGDRLVNRNNGAEIGVILQAEMDHTFPNGNVGSAVRASGTRFNQILDDSIALRTRRTAICVSILGKLRGRLSTGPRNLEDQE